MFTADEWAEFVFWRSESPNSLAEYIRQIQAQVSFYWARKMLDCAQEKPHVIKEKIQDLLEEVEGVE